MNQFPESQERNVSTQEERKLQRVKDKQYETLLGSIIQR